MPAVFAPMGQSPQICTVCQCINQFNQFICVSFFCFCFISFYFNPTWRTLDISSPNFVYRQTNKQTNTRSCLYSCSTTKKGPAGSHHGPNWSLFLDRSLDNGQTWIYSQVWLRRSVPEQLLVSERGGWLPPPPPVLIRVKANSVVKLWLTHL